MSNIRCQVRFIESTGRSQRGPVLTVRTIVASIVCVACALAASCSSALGNCIYTQPAPPARTRWVRCTYSRQSTGISSPHSSGIPPGSSRSYSSIPFVYRSLRARTSNQRWSARKQPVQQETVAPFTLNDPTIQFTRPSSTELDLPRFLGGAAQGTLIQASGTLASPLTLFTPNNQRWTYLPLH